MDFFVDVDTIFGLTLILPQKCHLRQRVQVGGLGSDPQHKKKKWYRLVHLKKEVNLTFYYFEGTHLSGYTEKCFLFLNLISVLLCPSSQLL
jgi:hypothetical protein